MTEGAPVRDTGLLEVATSRNILIPRLLAADKVFMPRRELVTNVLRFAASLTVSPDSQLVGTDRVKEALAKYYGGQKLIIVSNHVSDADHTIRRHLFEQNGFRDLADNIVLAAGVKMIERLHTRPFSYSEHRLNIPTPMDNARVREAKQNLGLYNPEEQAPILALEYNYIHLAFRAYRKMKKKYSEGGVLGLYPEATRSRTGHLGEAQSETANFIKHAKTGLILAVAVQGAEKILPPEKFPRILTGERARTMVVVGGLTPIEKLIEYAGKRPDKDQVIADVALAGVAELLSPRYITPTDRDRYAQTLQAFNSFRVAA